VADGGGRPVVLTALGSGEKILVLLPLAVMSVASVAGLAALGDGDPDTSPSPADSGTAAGAVAQETARQVPVRATPTSARPAISETLSPVARGESTGSDAVDEEPASMDDGSTAASAPAEPPAEPARRPADPQPTTPVPTASPTTTPDTTHNDGLTRVEATARCLDAGIRAVDVLALGACVEELLG
jgi:hypothetical protein